MTFEERQEGGVSIELDPLAQQMACTRQNAVEHIVGSYHRLVEIDLPVHEPSRDDELLDGIDAFFVDNEHVVLDVEHIDDALGADNTLADAGEEAVARQVVEPVHIELRGDELVQEMARIGVVENLYGCLQAATEFGVESAHKKSRQVLVVHIAEHLLGGVREGSVPYIVQQDGELHAQRLVVAYRHPLGAQHGNGAFHQIERTEHVAETAVHRPRIDQIGEAQLLDGALALKIGMFDDVVYQIVVYTQKPVNGIVDYLAFVCHER